MYYLLMADSLAEWFYRSQSESILVLQQLQSVSQGLSLINFGLWGLRLLDM